MSIDTVILSSIVAARHPLLTEFFVPVTALGSVVFAAILVAGLVLLKKQEAARMTALGIVVAGGIEHTLNLVFQRARPAVPRIIDGAASGYSFPSGHTTLAFVMATILAGYYPRLRTYLYVLAGVVAVSRLYLGVHFPTDVVAGALIGTAVGIILRRYHNNLPRISHWTDKGTGY